MTIMQSVVLGMVQGMTEFLPISSTGHLILTESWMRLSTEQLAGFDVMLHAGTLIALVLCYPVDWWRILRSPFTGDAVHRRLLLLLVIATIPGAVAGMLFEESIEAAMGSTRSLGVEFLLNAAVILIAERVSQRKTRGDLRCLDAVFIGCAQALALAPAISRSAMTISAARLLGIRRTDALNFSFLMATPIIAGASAMTFLRVARGEVQVPPIDVTAFGMISALLSSILAILFLRRFVARYSLTWFAIYLVVLGLLLCTGLSDKMQSL